MCARGVLTRSALFAFLLFVPGAAAHGPLPPIVFVSRAPVPGHPDIVPGLGPEGRAVAPGGRLMVRRPDGTVRTLLPAGRFHDVSDPSVSWDGRRIAFAATVAPESSWTLWRVDADGRGLAPLIGAAGPIAVTPGSPTRADDLDPCWLPDGRVCFASTRFAMVAQQGRLPVTNLWTVNADGSGLMRLTTERNGAEEPTVDPVTGRVVYARWWFNRWRASERDPSGLTLDTALAVPAEHVDLWQAITIRPDGEGMRLAGGDPRTRATTAAYQPLMLGDGTLVGVWAEPLSLVAPHGRPGVQIFPRGFAAPRRLGGGDTAACAPAALPDGRLLVSLDPRGLGDYGLWIAGADGRVERRLLDLPGTLELDAAVLAPRRTPPVIAPPRTDPPDTLPVAGTARLHDGGHTFRFDCLNVFTNAPLDQPFPDAPPLQKGVRIRFYAALDRPAAAGGDTAVLVREADVAPWGGVHEDNMPADVPMFEQLVDAHGRILRSSRGPAHVAGLNFAPLGSGTQCVGCHVGHSAITVPPTYSAGRWINASPSAQVTASSVASGTAGARAIADRRTRGPSREVGWVAEGARDEFVRLAWSSPIEVREVLIYALAPRRAEGTDMRVGGAEVRLFLDGREVERAALKGPLSPTGTPMSCRDQRVDAVEIRPTGITGRVGNRTAAALAEVVTIARLTDS